MNRKNDDFEYCMNYLARSDSKREIDVKLTIQQIKIIESGLEEYNGFLYKVEGTTPEYQKGGIWEGELPHEREAVKKLEEKLKQVQRRVFEHELSKEDIDEIRYHRLVGGSGFWSSGGTIQ
jgi:hypothetical protein